MNADAIAGIVVGVLVILLIPIGVFLALMPTDRTRAQSMMRVPTNFVLVKTSPPTLTIERTPRSKHSSRKNRSKRA